jgi:hypothetical protein
MKLVPATTSSTVDLSCVTAVDLLAIPTGDVGSLDIGYRESQTNQRVPCVDLAKAPTSFADIEAQIRGQFDVPMPAGGLAAIELRGRTGSCKDVPALDEAIFYGGAPVASGADSVDIPVRYNLSCDQAHTVTMRPLDLVKLVTTSTDACTAAALQNGLGFAADVRPTLLGSDQPPMLFEQGAGFGNLASGTATFPAYGQSFAGACPAVAWTDNSGNGASMACLDTSMPAACGNAGDVNLGTIAITYADVSYDMSQPYAAAVFGAVWSASAHAPVTGATVSLAEGANAMVVYGTYSASKFTPGPQASANGFLVYTNEVTGVTVSGPTGSRTVYVGGDFSFVPTALVVLP